MKYLICALSIIIATNGYCQITNIHTFSSASYFYASSNIRVNWAVGELFPETLTSNTVSISPGISDIEAIYLITDLEPNIKNLIVVSPIPFTNELTIGLGGNSGHDFMRISFNDLNGARI